MKRLMAILLVLLVGMSVVLTDAYAGRFGGGRSFGSYRSARSFSPAQSSPRSFKNPTAPMSRNSWLGPLAGLAAGGLLASLFMGNGIGNGLMSWLLLAGGIMLLMNLIRSFSRGNVQPVRMANTSHTYNTMYHESAARAMSPSIGVDENELLRQAKVQFIRLQAAHDTNNLADIARFTTPEVYAEIKMQLHERGNQPNHTDVVSLNAKLLETAMEQGVMFASVEFSGMIKEDLHGPAVHFNEIWHFRQEANSQVCLVAGIQQVHTV